MAGRRRADAHETPDLDAMVAAARSGETAAFGWIWESLAPRVHGYLRGRGAPSPEDLTSDVFLAAFTGLSSFRGDGAQFRSWLFTIAHHKSVDALRNRRDVVEFDPDDDRRTYASAEAEALAGGLDLDVRAALAALTGDQREVLLLRSLGDLSIEQVAELTGRSTGAVKQLYLRASAAARRALDADQGTAAQRTAEVGASDARAVTEPGVAQEPVTSSPQTAIAEL